MTSSISHGVRYRLYPKSKLHRRHFASLVSFTIRSCSIHSSKFIFPRVASLHCNQHTYSILERISRLASIPQQHKPRYQLQYLEIIKGRNIKGQAVYISQPSSLQYLPYQSSPEMGGFTFHQKPHLFPHLIPCRVRLVLSCPVLSCTSPVLSMSMSRFRLPI